MAARAFDITPHLDYIDECLSRGESLRMIASKIGVDRSTITKKLKERGIKTPSREESAKQTWKNHTHPWKGRTGADCPKYGKPVSEEWRKKMAAVWKSNGDRLRVHRKKHTQGYILIYVPDHPCADKCGYVLEHRIVYENHIGRILCDTEIVHHKNGKKDDNRLENLELVSRAEHAKIHKKLGENL